MSSIDWRRIEAHLCDIAEREGFTVGVPYNADRYVMVESCRDQFGRFSTMIHEQPTINLTRVALILAQELRP